MIVAMALGLLGVLGSAVVSGQSMAANAGDRGYSQDAGPQASAEAFNGIDRGTADAAADQRGQAGAPAAASEPTATTFANAQTFASPEAAVKAFIAALRATDDAKLQAIFGTQKGLLSSGDAIADRTAMQRFLKYYDKQHSLAETGAGRTTLRIGEGAWPFPIPIAKGGGGFYFDTAAGADTVVRRRMGRNELGAIAVCSGYVAAQKDYALAGHDGQPAGSYAQTLMSDPGKQNGLFWPVSADARPSPGGRLLAEAAAEGYRRNTSGKPTPYHGYLYRPLTAQGPHAQDGAKSFLRDGRQVDGFALVAYPADYGRTGRKTFIVNQDGIVYESDLGAQTAQIVAAMREFEPERSWRPAL